MKCEIVIIPDFQNPADLQLNPASGALFPVLSEALLFGRYTWVLEAFCLVNKIPASRDKLVRGQIVCVAPVVNSLVLTVPYCFPVAGDADLSAAWSELVVLMDPALTSRILKKICSADHGFPHNCLIVFVNARINCSRVILCCLLFSVHVRPQRAPREGPGVVC